MGQIDITGDRFGRLIVVSSAGHNHRGRTQWLCRCNCGNETKVTTDRLRNGTTRSCGCLYREALGDRVRKHGESYGANRRTRLYVIWTNMRQRCTNPKTKSFKNYGERGIRVCNEWDKYENFRDWAHSHGYSDDLTIDRIDNEANYSPESCRWVSKLVQANNKSNNHAITFHGISLNECQWQRLLHVSSGAFGAYLRRHGESKTIAYYAQKHQIDICKAV